jgi:CTP synthase
MGVGAPPTRLEPGSIAARCYGKTEISERHRHRYEFNNRYRQQFGANGMLFSGTSPDGSLVEVVELADHPFFVAVQYHPEFKSKPTSPQPLFAGFIAAAVSRSQNKSDRPAAKESPLPPSAPPKLPPVSKAK